MRFWPSVLATILALPGCAELEYEAEEAPSAPELPAERDAATPPAAPPATSVSTDAWLTDEDKPIPPEAMLTEEELVELQTGNTELLEDDDEAAHSPKKRPAGRKPPG